MTITQLKNILSRKFRGATIDDAQGISDYTLFEEAASNLLAEIDPMETVRHSELELFDGINDYSPPSDLKGQKIIDIRKQVRRQDDFFQTESEEFDRDKEEESFSVEFDEASKLLRIERSVGNQLGIAQDQFSATTNWTAAGGAANLAIDTILQTELGNSLRFDIGATGGNISNSSVTAVDLDDHENKASLFMWLYLPDASIVTSVTLRLGSSDSVYFSMTGAVTFGSLRNGWNLIKFNWNGATETGTVDTSAIDYVRIAVVSTAADTDLRISPLRSCLPSPYEVVYYSNAIFRPSSGSTWLTKPTAETDIINLESEHQNLFIYECCVLIAEDMQRDDDRKKFYEHLRGDGGKKIGLYDRYKSDKPSEAMRPRTRYYSTPRIRQ